jgi:hypothetical protein
MKMEANNCYFSGNEVETRKMHNLGLWDTFCSVSGIDTYAFSLKINQVIYL